MAADTDFSTFRVIVTGDRHWNCRHIAREAVRRLKERYGDRLVIVHGDAQGVDRAFAEACELQRVKAEAHPAQWQRLGPRAGPIRNQEMVDAGASLAVAVHRSLSCSKGTKDCVRRCLKAAISTWLSPTIR